MKYVVTCKIERINLIQFFGSMTDQYFLTVAARWVIYLYGATNRNWTENFVMVHNHYMNLIEANWWGLFPVVSQSKPCVCVCRLQRLVAQTVSARHLVNCPVHNVIGVFRQPKGCASMRPCTVATTPIGARSVGWAASPTQTSDATWQSTPAYATTSVMSVPRSLVVRGAWNDISVVAIRNLLVDAHASVL